MVKKKLVLDLSQPTPLIPAQPDDVLELDELWTFCETKENPVWIWAALCRRTRQIVGWCIGDRLVASCENLREWIAPEYQHCQTVSDKWYTYDIVFPPETHISAGKKSGLTAHIERFWNTARQKVARLVRKTLSFSKSLYWLTISFWSFVDQYNLSCISHY